MTLLLTFVISLSGIILGRVLLKKMFNHLTIYSLIWGVLVFLYELKLLPYVEISSLTWFLIISAFLSLILGSLTVIAARKINSKDRLFTGEEEISLRLLADNGKALKYSLIFFSVLTLASAIQHWAVLLKMYGSIPAVFINANKIYRLTSKGEIKGIIPYISMIGYVAIFFSGVYTVAKRRFSLLTFFPFLGVIIKELANVGRAGMLFALMEFLITFFLFKYLLEDDHLKRFQFSKKNAIAASIMLILFFTVSASLVKVSRGPSENYVGTSRELKGLKDNLILSPSLYLYLSSDVGVLSKYLDSEGENTKFGQNTFLPIYDFLAKFGLVERPEDFQRGYYIPMWTNTGTYIRELHADFGIPGVFGGPYLLGILITWLWFKFFNEKKVIVLPFLVFLNLIVGFSFLVIVTRLLYWFISLVIIVLYIPVLEKMALFFNKKSLAKSERT